ncbi:MAG: hypothetical protein AAGA68_26165 [Pseudomonadota bacterium]
MPTRWMIIAATLSASALASPTDEHPPPRVTVLLTTGVLLEGIGEALTIRDLAVANDGTWYLEVDTVTGGNTGGGGADQLDPAILSNDGIVINRLDRQPGEVFFPELTGDDPFYQLTTVEEIATLNGELVLFQNVQYLTLDGGAQFALAASFDTDLMWIEGVAFDGLEAGTGTLFASAFDDFNALLANGNVVQGFDVFQGGERTSGLFEVDPDDALRAVSVPFYDGQQIEGVGQVRSFTDASHEVGVSPNGRTILPLQVEDAGINDNTRVVLFNPEDDTYTAWPPRTRAPWTSPTNA